MSSILDDVNGKSVLLLNPPVADTHEAEERGMIASVAPFGLLRLGTYLRERGAQVTLLDCLRASASGPGLRRHVRKRLRCGQDGQTPIQKDIYHFGLTRDELSAHLTAAPRPDVIAISALFTWHTETLRETVAICRQACPGAKLVLGGNFVTLCPAEAASVGVDEIVVGNVPGAEFAPTAIDLLPQPQRTDFLRIVKGCPYRCSYCVTHLLNQGQVQARPPEDVYAEMLAKRRAFGIHSFVFYDDFVLFEKTNYLQPFLDLVIQSRLPFRLEFALGFSAHLVDERLVARLRSAGVKRLVLALETTNAARTLAMARPQHLETFKQTVRLVQAYGYSGRNLRAFYLIGLPGQTTEEILTAILWLYRLGVTPSLTTYTLTPGSRDVERYRDLVPDRSAEELAPCLWPFAHPGMKVAELDDIYRFFHEQYYPIERIVASRTHNSVIRAMQHIVSEQSA